MNRILRKSCDDITLVGPGVGRENLKVDLIERNEQRERERERECDRDEIDEERERISVRDIVCERERECV